MQSSLEIKYFIQLNILSFAEISPRDISDAGFYGHHRFPHNVYKRFFRTTAFFLKFANT